LSRPDPDLLKGTCWVSAVRQHKRKAKPTRRRVRIGAPGASLTGLAGLVAVDELTERLGMVAKLDAGIGPVKQRARGLSGGQLLLGMATAQLAGKDCLAGMDRVRADVVCRIDPRRACPTSRPASGT
jgi:hypothetical protein